MEAPVEFIVLKPGPRPMLDTIRILQTEAGSAVCELARRGADESLPMQLLDRDFRSQLPTPVVSNEYWSQEELSLLLFEPAGGNPDGPRFSNYLNGKEMPEYSRIVRSIKNLILQGMLPAEAVELVHGHRGIRRALEVFLPYIQNSCCLGRPSEDCAAQLTQMEIWHVQGQADFERLMKEDRNVFEGSRIGVLDVIFQLRIALTTRGAEEKENISRLRDLLARRLRKLIKSLNKLRVSQPLIRTSDRQSALCWTANVMPPVDQVGQPAIGPKVAAWLADERTEEELQQFEALRVRVLTEKLVDIRPKVDCLHDPAGSNPWRLATITEIEDDVVSENFGLTCRAQRFLRRCSRQFGRKRLNSVIFMRIIQGIYFGDERREGSVNRLEEDMSALVAILIDKRKPLPAPVDLKKMAKTLYQLHIEPWVGINADIAQPVPLLEQWWR